VIADLPADMTRFHSPCPRCLGGEDSCETNPISGKVIRLPFSVASVSPWWRFLRNKPNFGRNGAGKAARGSDCAKRTQFGGTGLARQGRKCCRHRGQTCETNPIGATVVRITSDLWKRSYGTFGLQEAMKKQSQFPAGQGVGQGPARPIVRNEARRR
jgi:hypothetical protein